MARSIRKGMGTGTGSGYRNIIPPDPRVHSQSAYGIKQPQQTSLSHLSSVDRIYTNNVKKFIQEHYNGRNLKEIIDHLHKRGVPAKYTLHAVDQLDKESEEMEHNSPATYDFYEDGAHGWMKVSLKELAELGLLDKISGFSYIRGNYVYLEEDADATLFVNAKKSLGQEVKFKEHHTDKQSKIRSYASFEQRNPELEKVREFMLTSKHWDWSKKALNQIKNADNRTLEHWQKHYDIRPEEMEHNNFSVIKGAKKGYWHIIDEKGVVQQAGLTSKKAAEDIARAMSESDYEYHPLGYRKKQKEDVGGLGDRFRYNLVSPDENGRWFVETRDNSDSQSDDNTNNGFNTKAEALAWIREHKKNRQEKIVGSLGGKRHFTDYEEAKKYAKKHNLELRVDIFQGYNVVPKKEKIIGGLGDRMTRADQFRAEFMRKISPEKMIMVKQLASMADDNKTPDKIHGGLGDNRPDSDFDPKELKKGIKVEMEHTKDPKIAKEIVHDHLTEFPHGYYKELAKMEKKLKRQNAKK